MIGMEGPSLVILKEETKHFIGKKILKVGGNTKTEKERLLNQTVIDFKSWGKHFIIEFKKFFVRIHFLMYGSYRIDEQKDNPRLTLKFKNGEFNFYNCSVKFVDSDFYSEYDEETDIMSDKWNERKALAALKKLPKKTEVCDALLSQKIFSGVGNIIKNEVLYRIRIHPQSYVSALSLKQRKELVKEARVYSFDFYRWKKGYELRKHYVVYKKSICPRCNIKYTRKHLGNPKRLTFFCSNCQLLYR
jgi:endonuclease VIII